MEDKEGRGKKRLISNFTIAHSTKSVSKSQKKWAEARMCYYVKVTIRTKTQAFLNTKKWMEGKIYPKTM